MTCAPLLIASGVLALIDLNSSRKAYQVRHTFADVCDDDDSDDDVTNETAVYNLEPDTRQDDGNIDFIDVARCHMSYLDRSSLWQEDSLA